MATEARFDEILRTLSSHEVDYIVVGGVAAVLQGSPLTTEDVDIVFASNDENLARLASALDELEALYLDPAGRQISPDAGRLASTKINLLRTKYGRLDALRSVGNELGFEDLVARSAFLEVDGFAFRVLGLEAIIETKEQANRPKDQYQLPYLRQLLDEIQGARED